MNSPGVPFFQRKKIRESGVILGVLLFGGIYFGVPAFSRVIDKVIDPAVSGITVLYSSISTSLHKHTGLNLGFVQEPVDSDFLFSVRLATYVNERQAKPIVEMATNLRMSSDKRERALRSLLKFDSTSDWVQPFLNELPKGGMLGLYDKETPVIDELIKKIRAEGGLRQPLIRAYAEVVFSFMMQVPDAVVRTHALRWVSDVLAEDALFLILPRLSKEEDEDVQTAIELALYDVRAVSDQKSATQMLLPLYKKPPWPTVRLPLAVILTRLGYEPAMEYLEYARNKQDLTELENIAVRVAMAKTRYPFELKITKAEEKLMAKRAEDRRQQIKAGIEKRQRLIEQERMKQVILARAKETSQERPLAKPAGPRVSKADQPQAVTEDVPQKPAPKAEKRVAQATGKSEPPKPFSVPGKLSPEEKSQSKPAAQVARVPEGVMLPPHVPGSGYQPKSLMNYVDLVFEVKETANMYQSPGEKDKRVGRLKAGSKDKATFEAMIGDEKWLQVETSSGKGWVEAGQLNVFNLSPDQVVPVATSKAAASSRGDDLDGARKESTYFEPVAEGVSAHAKPSEKSKVIAALTVGTVYKAIKSEKVGSDRWFLMQVKSDLNGWVKGDMNLQLANVMPVSQSETPPVPVMKKEPSFTAEYVKAGVKGVGVYDRKSLGSNLMMTIDPDQTYKVLELSQGGGSEWYKIQITKQMSGWVQMMDVQITKKPK